MNETFNDSFTHNEWPSLDTRLHFPSNRTNNVSYAINNETSTSNSTQNEPSSLEAAEITQRVLFWIALSGNILVIFTILLQRSLKTNYYLLVLHLAACDATIVLTIILWKYILPIVPGSQWKYVDVAIAVINDTAYLAELGIITWIAVARYRAVSHPFVSGLARKKLFCIIVLLYTLALTMSIILRVVGWNTANVTSKVLDVIFFNVPFFATSICLPILYTRMCYLLYVHSKQMKNFNSEARDNCSTVVDMRHLTARQERNRKTTRTSILVVALFLFFSVPREIAWLGRNWNFSWHSLEYLSWNAVAYTFGVTTVNPFIYAFSDKAILAGYKKTLRKLVGLCKRKARSHANEEPEEATTMQDLN